MTTIPAQTSEESMVEDKNLEPKTETVEAVDTEAEPKTETVEAVDTEAE